VIISIDLSPEIEASVKTQAERDGIALEDYIKSLVKEGSERRERIELLAEKSFDDILAPFRRNVTESGLTDEELDALFSVARRAASRAKRERSHE
jgi:hypothetical protein